MRYKTINRFRKAHRYLGLFIGVQFLFWTFSGLYFSWTNIDDIHGDHYLTSKETVAVKPENLSMPFFQTLSFPIHQMTLKMIDDSPFFWVNDSILINPKTGKALVEISEKQALAVVKKNVLSRYSPKKIERIHQVGPHSEYRGRPLPAYRIVLSGEGAPVAYVDAKNGDFQRVRHTQWRWFDFLWMTHTMDYQGRDNFNTLLLRAFSLFGLITVLSGFTLAFVTSSWGKSKKR
ncbi:MAG: PepSY domain-containing protein [Flavobacteriaceae bacterium]